jgi:hypothetical protein
MTGKLIDRDESIHNISNEVQHGCLISHEELTMSDLNLATPSGLTQSNPTKSVHLNDNDACDRYEAVNNERNCQRPSINGLGRMYHLLTFNDACATIVWSIKSNHKTRALTCLTKATVIHQSCTR